MNPWTLPSGAVARAGAGSPLFLFHMMDPGQQKGITAERCAAKILRALEREKDEVFIGGKEVMAVYLKRFWPGLLNRLLRKASVT